MKIAQPARLLEMVEAAKAREGENSNIEKAATICSLFIGITHCPSNILLREAMWKAAMIDSLGDLIKMFYPDDSKRKEFIDSALTPVMAVLKSDLKDAFAELNKRA